MGDNGSDDDVIEVVRDEAPIEILSDGEEMEIQKSKRVDLFTHTYNEFNLTQQVIDSGSEDKLYRQEDPYKNSRIVAENTLHAGIDKITELPMCTTSIEDSKTDDKSNHDSSGENCFVNVTDVVSSSDNEAEKLKQTVKEELESKQASGFSIDVTVVKDLLDPISNLASGDNTNN